MGGVFIYKNKEVNMFRSCLSGSMKGIAVTQCYFFAQNGYGA